MPKVRRTSYNLGFKLKVVAEPEAVENNSEIARNYGISERKEEKIVEFHRFVIAATQRCDYPLSRVIYE